MDVGFGFWVVVGVVCGEGVISGREFWDGEFALFIGFGVYGLVGFYRVFGVFECGEGGCFDGGSYLGGYCSADFGVGDSEVYYFAGVEVAADK